MQRWAEQISNEGVGWRNCTRVVRENGFCLTILMTDAFAPRIIYFRFHLNAPHNPGNSLWTSLIIFQDIMHDFVHETNTLHNSLSYTALALSGPIQDLVLVQSSSSSG